ncbi:MAG: hypothetical protein HYW70_02595, partial [Candidatus Nealsonbacteria bacterium]|nr:hypothetical protein [Candidatus Nealsonbacteria bacterium]
KEEIEALFRKRSEYLNKDCELVWCQSPKDLAKRSVDCLNKNDQFRDQFVVQLRDQFRNQLRDQFWVQLRDQFVVQLRDRFRDHLWDQLWVRSMVQFRGQLWVQFWDQFWDIYYCAYYDFLYNALPVKKFKNYFRFTREAFEYGLGFFLQTRNKIFLLPMPRCFIDDQRRLHREGGPAIEWPDGTKEYYYQGIGVPEELILRPENINPEDILKQRNAAVRGVMMTLTKSRLLKHFPSKLVDKSVWGELYQLACSRVLTRQPMIIATCLFQPISITVLRQLPGPTG